MFFAYKFAKFLELWMHLLVWFFYACFYCFILEMS